MARLIIKTKILNKEEQRRRTMQVFLEIQNILNSSSSFKENLKDKFHKSFKTTPEGWKNSDILKYEIYEDLKCSRFVRIVATTVLFLSLLENCLTQDIAFLTLGFGLYTLLFVINVVTSAQVYYRIASGMHTSHWNHIENINSMLMKFFMRLGVIKKRYNLEVSDAYFSVKGEYRTRQCEQFKQNTSLFSLYNFYGIPIAIFIFTLIHNTQIEVFIYLESFVFYFAIIVALVKDVKANNVVTQMRKRYENMGSVIQDFKHLIEKQQNIKGVLHDFYIMDDCNSLFHFPGSNLLKEEKDLNFVIFATVCEPILHLNLSIDKLENIILYLLYGNVSEILNHSSATNIKTNQTAASLSSTDETSAKEQTSENESSSNESYFDEDVSFSICESQNNSFTTKQNHEMKFASSVDGSCSVCVEDEALINATYLYKHGNKNFEDSCCDVKLKLATQNNLEDVKDNEVKSVTRTILEDVQDNEVKLVTQANLADVKNNKVKLVIQTSLEDIKDKDIKLVTQANLEDVKGNKEKLVTQTDLKYVKDNEVKLVTQANLEELKDNEVKLVTQTNLEAVKDSEVKIVAQTILEGVKDNEAKLVTQTDLGDVKDNEAELVTPTSLEGFKYEEVKLEDGKDNEAKLVTPTSLEGVKYNEVKLFNQAMLEDVKDNEMKLVTQTNLENVKTGELKLVSKTNLKDIKDDGDNLVDSKSANTESSSLRQENNKNICGTKVKYSSDDVCDQSEAEIKAISVEALREALKKVNIGDEANNIGKSAILINCDKLTASVDKISSLSSESISLNSSIIKDIKSLREISKSLECKKQLDTNKNFNEEKHNQMKSASSIEKNNKSEFSTDSSILMNVERYRTDLNIHGKKESENGISIDGKEKSNTQTNLDEMMVSVDTPDTCTKYNDSSVVSTDNTCLRHEGSTNLEDKIKNTYISDYDQKTLVAGLSQKETVHQVLNNGIMLQCLSKDDTNSSIECQTTEDVLMGTETCKNKESTPEIDVNEQNYENLCHILKDIDVESLSSSLSDLYSALSVDDKKYQYTFDANCPDTGMSNAYGVETETSNLIEIYKFDRSNATDQLLNDKNIDPIDFTNENALSEEYHFKNLCDSEDMVKSTGFEITSQKKLTGDKAFPCISDMHYDENEDLIKFDSSENISSEKISYSKNSEEIMDTSEFENTNSNELSGENCFTNIFNINYFDRNDDLTISDFLKKTSPDEILSKTEEATNDVEPNSDGKQHISLETPIIDHSEQQNMFEETISTENCLNNFLLNHPRRIIKGRRNVHRAQNVVDGSKHEEPKESLKKISGKKLSNNLESILQRRMIKGRRKTHLKAKTNVNTMSEERKLSYHDSQAEMKCDDANECAPNEDNFSSLDETKSLVEEKCHINTTEDMMSRTYPISSNDEVQFSSVNETKALLARQCSMDITDGQMSSSNSNSREDHISCSSGTVLNRSPRDLLIVSKKNDTETRFCIGANSTVPSQKIHSPKKRLNLMSESDDEYYVNESIRGSFKTVVTVSCLSNYRKSKLCKVYDREKSITKIPEKNVKDLSKCQVEKSNLVNKVVACNKTFSEVQIENVSEKSLGTPEGQYEESFNNSAYQYSKLQELNEDESHTSSSCYEERSLGTSEDANFHFRNSTSPDDSKSWSTVETNSQLTENDNSEYELQENTMISEDLEENFTKHCASHQTLSGGATKYRNTSTTSCETPKVIPIDSFNNSQKLFSEENEKITWKSDLCMTDMINMSQRAQENIKHRTDEQESYYVNECEDQNGPIKYTLRYENLDLNMVDTASCITLRLVSDMDHKNALPPKWLNRSGNLSKPIYKSEDDVLFIPLVESSSCSSDTPFVKISKNDLTMSAESTEINLSNSNLSSGTNKNALETLDESQFHNTNVASADNKIATATKYIEPEVTEIKSGNDCKQIQEAFKAGDIDGTSHDSNAYVVKQTKGKETQQECMAIVNPEDKDFHFETENLNLNYKPNPRSGSIQISFRKRHDATKLVFKSDEKKLYVKISPLR